MVDLSVKHESRPTTPIWLRLLGVALFVINAVFIVVATLAADGDLMFWLPLPSWFWPGCLDWS